MNTSLAPTAPAVSSEQIDLIKRTVAKDATADELRLYLYDCERQGVHPLDKLIHFTKRQGKYTPITSIDFMRSRAADTGEYAGNDDPLFVGQSKTDDFAATVTVWRIVQGIRCAFTATARWSEYKPSANDFMWLKMGHTMLGKCAEALALRKGFPRQLAGLYAREEMVQAGQPDGEALPNIQQEPKQITPTLDKPDGFDAWFAALEASAELGVRAMAEAWLGTTPENRKYLARTNDDTRKALRTKAEAVDLAAQQDDITAAMQTRQPGEEG